MPISSNAMSQGVGIILLGYLLWAGIPTVLGNLIGPGVVGVVVPVLNAAVLVVPVAAGARAARLAAHWKFGHGIAAGAVGVSLVLAGLLLFVPAAVSAAGYAWWLVGGIMLAWLGAILEPHVFPPPS